MWKEHRLSQLSPRQALPLQYVLALCMPRRGTLPNRTREERSRCIQVIAIVIVFVGSVRTAEVLILVDYSAISVQQLRSILLLNLFL
jgi:hypothetical protein